tara:strand:- start:929 stop:1597 length:669 start_codon:yes stop_codon:yes gene_type:complete
MGFDYFFAGCMSGIVQTIVGHPLDTLKILKQNNKLIRNNIYNIHLKQLYSGVSMPLMQTPLACGVGFYVDEIINNYVCNHWISGFASGIVGSFLLCPFEYYKIHLQQNNKQIINIKTLLGSYKNISYVILREAPALSIYFGSYNELKKKELPMYISGGIAGCCSWFFTYPLDTIKSRIQGNICKTMKDAIKMGNLFSGLHYCLLRAFIANSIGFTTYEYCIK